MEAIRRSLAAGQEVEIEGLGVFKPSKSGARRFEPQIRSQVFLAYASEDLRLARRLAERLRAGGCSPWLDQDRLLPGQNWPRAIERAIEMSDAVVACFSPRSVVKTGHFQCELRYALDCAKRVPMGETFLIPVRLEECAVPARIARELQYIDLFPDWEKAMKQLLRSVQKAARNRPVAEWSATI